MNDPRKDRQTRSRVDELKGASHKLILSQWVVGSAVTVALALGGYNIRENNNRIDDIQNERLRSSRAFCVADSDKNGVIRRFILFSVRGDKNSRLYVEARRSFPLRGLKDCEREARTKVNK